MSYAPVALSPLIYSRRGGCQGGIIQSWGIGDPFQPFDIRVSDGRAYTVDHPDFLSRSRTGKFVAYTTDNDRVIIIDLGRVTTLEIINHSSCFPSFAGTEIIGIANSLRAPSKVQPARRLGRYNEVD